MLLRRNISRTESDSMSAILPQTAMYLSSVGGMSAIGLYVRLCIAPPIFMLEAYNQCASSRAHIVVVQSTVLTGTLNYVYGAAVDNGGNVPIVSYTNRVLKVQFVGADLDSVHIGPRL